jgi:hypothetical protein
MLAATEVVWGLRADTLATQMEEEEEEEADEDEAEEEAVELSLRHRVGYFGGK